MTVRFDTPSDTSTFPDRVDYGGPHGMRARVDWSLYARVMAAKGTGHDTHKEAE